jgi:hypothetical protein
VKVGKAKVAIKGLLQAIMKTTGRDSVGGKWIMISGGAYGRFAKHSSAQRGDGKPRSFGALGLVRTFSFFRQSEGEVRVTQY